MSFWDEHEGIATSGGGMYLSAEEKEVLAETGDVFPITNVKLETENKYGPRYVLFIELADPVTGDITERAMGLAKGSNVASRDRTLQAMLDDHFDAGNKEPIQAVLRKKGNAYTVEPPEAS